jgi:hypothetical protein
MNEKTIKNRSAALLSYCRHFQSSAFMKKFFYLPVLVLVAMVSLLSSCKKHPAMHVVKIDVQGLFQNDRVRLFIDGKQLLDKVVATESQVIGVCPDAVQIPDTIKEGKHIIKAIVNDVSYSEEFSLTKDLYIGVGYFRPEKRIFFEYADEPFQYL